MYTVVHFVYRFHVRSLQANIPQINCNLLQHVWKATATGSLMACGASNIGYKCIAMKNNSGYLHCVKLPFF